MNPRRVVHVLPKFSASHWGGAEQSILGTAPHLAELGFKSEVWTNNVFNDAPEELVGETLVRRFPARFLTKDESALAGMGKSAVSGGLLKALVRERPRPDVIHAHTHNRTSSAVMLLARAIKVPGVLTLHSRFKMLQPRIRYWFPNEVAINRAHSVVVVSSAIEAALRAGGMKPKDLTRIPNGVDPAPYRSGDGERFRREYGIVEGPLVLCVGRLYGTKNQIELVRAFSLLQERSPRATLVLIGFPSDEAYVAELERTIDQPALSGRVVVLKDVGPGNDSLYDAYAAADVVAVPSLFEAFPLVALEAWASGTPLVASATGGLSEMIDEGKDGIFIAHPDDPSSITDAIERVLRDEILAASLARAGTDAVARYRWDLVARDVAAVYERVLAARGKPATAVGAPR